MTLTVILTYISNGCHIIRISDAVELVETYNRKEYHDLNTSGNDFGFDANGNMLYDLDRDIVTIRYNLLNLPDTVQFRDGRQIINKYAADGKRLASTYYTPTHITVQPLSIGEVADYHSYPQYLLDRVRTWFVGNKEYGLMYPEHYDYLELKKVYTDEGYVTTNGQSDNCDYHYYRRDHLGNVREVWKPSGDSTLTVQRTRYYPSGLPWEYQPGDSASLQSYKYEGKEFVETHGLDMYDSHARWYDPATMRTTTPDPLAEKYYDTSPYAWCGNNPVNAVDPTGMDIWELDQQGHVEWKEESEAHRLYSQNEDGERSDNFIEVWDRDILDQLTMDREELEMSYALTKSKEVGDLFLFLAQNSTVEWGLQGVKTKEGTRYIIGTSFDDNFVKIDNMRNNLNFQENQLTFDIHSHPNVHGTKGASGVLPNGNYKGDMQRITNRYYRFNKKNIDLPNHYVYHKYSNNLYHYTPWESSIFIKSMKSKNSFNFLIK